MNDDGTGQQPSGTAAHEGTVASAAVGHGEAPPQAGRPLPGAGDAERSAARALLHGTSQISWLLEADGVVRWVSPAVTRTLGYEPAEVVGSNIVSFVHPDEAQTALALLAFGASHRLDGGFDHDGVDMAIDFRMRHRQGRWITTETLVNNFLATPGINAILAVSREATGRRALDNALTALAQDSTGDEALLRLLAFLEIRLSDAHTALYWPQSDPPWTTSSVPPVLLTPDGPWVGAVARGEYAIIDDIEAAARDGVLSEELGRMATEAGYVACWCIPVPARPHPDAGYSYGLPGEDREPIATLVIWSARYRRPGISHWGLTERVAGLAYFALSRRVADIERQAHLEREREQNQRLQELDKMKTDLILSVSHELRTPLTSIISFTDLLKSETYTAEEQASYLDIIGRNANRLLRVVEDLLFLGRLESRMVSVAMEPIDVPRLVVAAAEAISPTAQGSGVAVEQAIIPGPPLVGDAERVRQLVDNLLSNAVKYTGQGGRVRIEAHPLVGGWQVTVVDNGIGISEDEQQQVFDRFFRGSNARKAQISGSGLGLAIAHAVAELHHGAIDLSTTEGGGCTFVATLHDA